MNLQCTASTDAGQLNYPITFENENCIITLVTTPEDDLSVSYYIKD